MAFSEMNAKEKTIVAVLGAVILLSLAGIGVMMARLISSGGGTEEAVAVTVVPTVTVGQVGPGSTITPVQVPSPQAGGQSTPAPVSDKPAVVARMQSPLPGSPVIIASQALTPGRRYRLEVSEVNGAQVAIQGSWGQAATSASGQVASPEIEFFEGATPFRVDVSAPVADPVLWSCSISAGPADVLGPSPTLVITVYDVTGVQ